MGKVREWTGAKDQKAAARDANASAQKAGKRSIKFQRDALRRLRKDLQPFREVGEEAIGLSSFLTDPQEQADFIRTNPLFQAALESVNEATMQNQAARGKLGSGGTLEALQGNFMTSALPFIDRQSQNINNLLSIGQNAAARSGNAGINVAQGTGNILQNMANVAGATAINRGDIQAQSQNDLFGTILGGGTGALLGSGILGGAALGGGSALSGAGLGALIGLCDERLKENIKPLYKDDDGLTVYEFTYKADGAKRRFEGKMAQDILKIEPDAVYETDEGFLAVSPKYAPIMIQEAV